MGCPLTTHLVMITLSNNCENVNEQTIQTGKSELLLSPDNLNHNAYNPLNTFIVKQNLHIYILITLLHLLDTIACATVHKFFLTCQISPTPTTHKFHSIQNRALDNDPKCR